MSNFPDEIKASVEDAIASLQAAKEHLEQGNYESAASRASDSAFRTAQALLLDENVDPTKHGEVITLIQAIFVNGRRLTKEQGANLNWLFAMRKSEQQKTSRDVKLEEAQKAVEIAASFFEAAKVILEG